MVESFNTNHEVISSRIIEAKKYISRIDAKIQQLALEKAYRLAEISEDKKKLTAYEEKWCILKGEISTTLLKKRKISKELKEVKGKKQGLSNHYSVS